MLVTKKIDTTFSAVLIDWRLFENPYLSLDEIKVPVAEFDELDELDSIFDNLLSELKENLSLEEMETVKQTASKVNATISGYAPQYIDESFKDKILKTNDKSANRAGYEKVSISEEEKEFQRYLTKRADGIRAKGIDVNIWD